MPVKKLTPIGYSHKLWVLLVCSIFATVGGLLTISTIMAATTISFSTAVKYSAGGTGSSAVVVGDVNKDGKKDLLVANTSSNNVGVLLGRGDGTFQAATVFPVGGTAPLALKIGDFNGDGKPDLVTVNSTTSNISVLLGDGTGAFGTAVNFPTGSLPYGLDLADFNNDGNLDVLTVNSADNSVSLLLGDGTGHFAAPVNFSVGNSPQWVVVADFNGDGKPDAATANYNSNNLSVLINNGSGGFNTAVNYAVGNKPIQLAAGDFDGNNKVDLVVANYGSSSTSLLLGNGDGTFGAANDFSAPQTAIVVDDFNLDGKPDIAVSSIYNTSVGVLANNGAAGFNSVLNFPASANPYGLATGDFNGDGKADIVTVNNSTANVSIILNTTNPPTAKVNPTNGTPQSTIVNTAFSTSLQVKVVDAVAGTPISGTNVVFTAPFSGSSGRFGSSNTANVTTAADGTATAPTFTANCQAGSYRVTADVNGAATPAYFYLTNQVSTPAIISAVAGTPQSATYNTAFATAFKAVVRDGCSNPISGASVLFSAPSSGASGTFTNTTNNIIITTDATGTATAPIFTANNTVGSYTVNAWVIGFSAAGTATYNLTNKAGPPASITVVANSTPQSAVVNTVFANSLGVSLLDAANHPVAGTTVTFVGPANGASGTFANNNSTSTNVTSDSNGVATAPAFKANCTAGSYTVTATVSNLPNPAVFTLTNQASVPASIVPYAGLNVRTIVSTTFDVSPKATVRDSCGNGVSNQPVTFTAPSNGATGVFPGGSSVVVTTGIDGVAAAPTLTANGITGVYTVTASVVTSPTLGLVNYPLTNLPVNYGDYAPRTYQINTAQNGTTTMPGFAPPLQRKWTVHLESDNGYGFVTYAIAAEHKVFVLSSTPNLNYGNRLWALDPATGQTIWGPVSISHVYYWASLAYDNGRVFVFDDDAKLSAFNASDGSFIWSGSGGNGFAIYDMMPPVATNGMVFTRYGGQLTAWRATDGQVLWTKPTLTTNDTYAAGASVFADESALYVAGSCHKVYKYGLYDGASIWTYDPGCPYYGLNGTVYANKVFVRADSNPPGLIVDAINGTKLGNWIPTGLLPSFSGNIAFMVNSNGRLEGYDINTGQQVWSKGVQNGSFSVAPVVINGIAYVGATDGNIYGYDANGVLQWQASTGSPNGIGDARLISGLGAGENLLLVPTAGSLVAWEPINGSKYSSDPAPGSTLDLGSSRLATTLTSTISISNTGGMDLTLSSPVLSGTNASDFAISGPAFPFTVTVGAPAQPLSITCTPQRGGVRTAMLSFHTNDVTHTSVSYDLKCTGTLIVVQPNDDGSGNLPGTLSFYLTNQRAGAGQTISFSLSGTQTISITGTLPSVPAGVTLDGGSCGPNGPAITLNGSGVAPSSDGLVLLGHNVIKNLKVTHFPGRQLVTRNPGNILRCVVLQK